MRTRDLLLNLTRAGLATAATVAMAYQFGALDQLPSFSPGNFFSFFTIQSNVLAVLVLVLTAIVPRAERTRLFDAFRCAVTLYMAITGVVFALLLSGLQESLDTHTPWVDFIVHRLIPVVMVADWLLDPPRHRFRLRAAAAWLVFPVAWFVYTLVRGARVDWYPYPFVDVEKLGHGGVFLRSLVLLGGFAVAAAAVALLGNLRAGRQA